MLNIYVTNMNTCYEDSPPQYTYIEMMVVGLIFTVVLILINLYVSPQSQSHVILVFHLWITKVSYILYDYCCD